MIRPVVAMLSLALSLMPLWIQNTLELMILEPVVGIYPIPS